MENCELTEDELAAAVLAAKRIKMDKIERERLSKLREEREAEIRRPWNSEELFNYIIARAANEYRINLVIDKSNENIYRMFNRYFSGDERFELMGDGFSLSKGLLVRGNVGTGKSTIMQLYGRNKRQCYNMVACRRVSAMYAEDGHSVTQAYKGPRMEPSNDPRLFYQKQIGYCFDDLGTEDIKKNFGNELNVMADIIQNRYDEKHRYPFTQTHITTNLTVSQIEDMYGSRVKSRMREMFNVIDMDGDDRRK